MSGKISTVDKILNAIGIVKNIDKDCKYDVESILYTFANKFLSGKDLEFGLRNTNYFVFFKKLQAISINQTS